ncbi:MAG: hypothetical protein HP041_05800 [Oscillospiraceae bacterium]|nr:hypothetical protein [Oscillospiraceae bacterium]
MQKGKFGVCLWFYAVLAFVLAFLGQTLLCGLLLGFVILAEKNEWLSKQVMQAFFLTLASSLVGSVLDILNVFRSIPFLGTAVSVVFNGITGLVSLIILVFCIIAITKVVKEQDAGLPLVSKLANRAFGLLEQKVYTQAAPAQPVQPAAPAQPLYPQQPAYTGTQAPGQNNGQQPPQQ